MTRASKATHLLTVLASVIGAAAWMQYANLDTRSLALGVSCPTSGRAMARLELLFGTTHARGAPITEDEWTAFLDAEVTPRFPDGLTVLQGRGQWRGDNDRLTREQSHILVIWHEQSAGANTEIEAIRTAYKQRFAQESVMRVDSVSCVSF